MQTTFKGTDTIATILSSFGKIKTNGTKTFTLKISELESILNPAVKVSAIPTKEEKDAALAMLTPAEQVTLVKLTKQVNDTAKVMAETRVKGQTAERWTTKGIASLV
jgi:predicted transglutaminase-like cysteine proteinase